MRHFHGLVERTISNLMKAFKKGSLPDLDKEGFAKAAQRLVADPDRAFLLGAGVAASIAPASTWSDKIARLLDLADAAPEEPRARVAALQAIETPLAEIIGSRAGMADLLDTTVASVNSALQRARATLAEVNARTVTNAVPADQQVDPAVLDRWVQAFEAYDIDALTLLVREDAIQSMPPYELWLQGRHEIMRWWAGPGAECEGSRMVKAPVTANGYPAYGQYRPSGPGGRHEPWSLQVLMLDGDHIGEFAMFLDTDTVFPLFGLPPHPDDPLLDLS